MINFARSPFFILETFTGADEARLTLNIGSPILKTYNITKTGISSDVRFEISELVRDYIEINYSGTASIPNVEPIDVSYTVEFYTNNSLVNTVNKSIKMTDGYDLSFGAYNQGLSNTMLLQENKIIYSPFGEELNIPFYDSVTNSIDYVNVLPSNAIKSGYAYSDGIETIQFYVYRDCNIYDPIRVSFVNRYGVIQDIFINARSNKKLDVTRDTFNHNNWSQSGSSLNQISDRSQTVLNVSGSESIEGNTGLVDEDYKEVMKDLTLSEKVWLTIDGQIIPATPTIKSVNYKTSVNDKAQMNYTLSFDIARDVINNTK